MTDRISETDGTLRKLRRTDTGAFAEHLLRLDAATRHSRFGSPMGDSFLRGYAQGALGIDSVVFGSFPDGHLRGVGELRWSWRSLPPHGEISLSIETDWQSRGIGTALFARLTEAAQNRRMKSLHILYMNENTRMRRIVEKQNPGIEFHGSQVEVTFDPPRPTAISLAHEAMADVAVNMRWMFLRAT